MAWYIRKGINFGLVRLNLSKGGLGLSVGVKGLRVGRGPRGAYVHAGREGLYYRKQLHLKEHLKEEHPKEEDRQAAPSSTGRQNQSEAPSNRSIEETQAAPHTTETAEEVFESAILGLLSWGAVFIGLLSFLDFVILLGLGLFHLTAGLVGEAHVDFFDAVQGGAIGFLFLVLGVWIHRMDERLKGRKKC